MKLFLNFAHIIKVAHECRNVTGTACATKANQLEPLNLS